MSEFATTTLPPAKKPLPPSKQKEKPLFALPKDDKITNTAGKSVKTGSVVYYHLEQKSPTSGVQYRWIVYNSEGHKMVDKTSPFSAISLTAQYPGDYMIQVQLLKGGEWLGEYHYEQNVYYEETNTELGGLNVGNFDFKFDGNTSKISVDLKFAFASGISTDQQDHFKVKFFEAINEYWGNNQVSFVVKGSYIGKKIPLIIEANEVSSGHHKLVDVTKDHRRPKVIMDINVYLNISKKTIAHEFGHVLGLYDEYDGGAVENAMWWHSDDKYQSDTSALMNAGTELRNRYFEHIMEKMTEVSKDVTYQIESPWR